MSVEVRLHKGLMAMLRLCSNFDDMHFNDDILVSNDTSPCYPW